MFFFHDHLKRLELLWIYSKVASADVKVIRDNNQIDPKFYPTIGLDPLVVNRPQPNHRCSKWSMILPEISANNVIYHHWRCMDLS